MYEIPVYRAEVDCGLADSIRANASIAYCTQLEKWSDEDHKALANLLENSPEFAKANVQDLYPTKSVLVTTNWNKNDDIFGRLPTWAARHTPVNKPTNLEHDEKQLVGHMTGAWAVDFDGKILADNLPIDELPQHFHLCNSAVIYMAWQDKALKKRTDVLIASIEKGDMFVSMECLFAGFDYALVTPEGKHIILPRESSTAHLTQHLRAYGGSGTYEGHKIGRFLQNILFTAKGYTGKPANSESIIFSSAGVKDLFVFEEESKENPFEQDAGVSLDSSQLLVAETLNQGNNEMSDILQNQINELKQSLTAAQAENSALADQLAKADVEKYESRIAELEGIVQANKDADEDKKKKDKEAKARVEELEAKVTELTEANASLETAKAEAEAEKLTATRVSLLVDGGIVKDKAEATVAKFDNLNDEQFEAVASTLIDAAKAQVETPDVDESEEEVDDAGEASAEQADLENAEASEETDGTVERDTATASDKTRLNLAKLMADSMGLKFGEDN